jgi:hypothetical protein
MIVLSQQLVKQPVITRKQLHQIGQLYSVLLIQVKILLQDYVK